MNLFLGQGMMWRRRLYLSFSFSVLFFTFIVSFYFNSLRIFCTLSLLYLFSFSFMSFAITFVHQISGWWGDDYKGMWRRVHWYSGTNVSEEPAACIFRIEESSETSVFIYQTIWRRIPQDSNLFFLSLVSLLFDACFFRY
jgi:hypothetical protein